MLSSTFNTYIALATIFASVSARSHGSHHRRNPNPVFNERTVLQTASKAQAATDYVVCDLGYQSKLAAFALGEGSNVSPCVAPAMLGSSSASSTPTSLPTSVVVSSPIFTSTSTVTIATPLYTPNAKPVNDPIVPYVETTPGNAPCSATGPSNCELQALALNGHNEARRIHHAEPLTWNDTLATSSLKWAKNCQWKHSGQTSFDFPYGENLYATTDLGGTMENANNAFISEEKYYNYSSPAFSEESGHFTQVVWKATTQIGCSMITCDLDIFSSFTNQTQFYVCQYLSAGNWIDEMAANVLAP